MINYLCDGTQMPKILKRKISKWIKSVALEYGKRVGDIGYLFCNDKKIIEINRQYLDHDYFTDIITFDYTEENIISGDIFISIDTVSSNAKAYGVSFDQELKRVIIHGILHLCGQNDHSEEEQKEMRLKEDKALEMLQYQ
ncbi:MAG: rRNA maturation RNase YbeY [Bacteroidales bacterium]|nr:MAG: rRNA maturation RNase YbeY [Bacteroidales bacterium]